MGWEFTDDILTDIPAWDFDRNVIPEVNMSTVLPTFYTGVLSADSQPLARIYDKVYGR